MATEQINVRVEKALVKRLRKATVESKNPFSPTISQIVERGIELALKELNRRTV